MEFSENHIIHEGLNVYMVLENSDQVMVERIINQILLTF